ncbi:mCG1042688, partial [Mus musculus]
AIKLCRRRFRFVAFFLAGRVNAGKSWCRNAGCDRILSVEAGGGLLTTLQSMKPGETKRGSDDSSFPFLMSPRSQVISWCPRHSRWKLSHPSCP